MTAPIYLYSYGTRRHIADPIQHDPTRPHQATNWAHMWSLCDQVHETDAYMVDRARYARDADEWVQKKRNEPVCARCQRMWDRQQEAGA